MAGYPGVQVDRRGREARLLRQAGVLADRHSRLLEIGAGDGRLTRRLASGGQEIVALEPDPIRFARATRRRAVRRITFLPLNLEDYLPGWLAQGRLRFDRVVLSWSL